MHETHLSTLASDKHATPNALRWLLGLWLSFCATMAFAQRDTISLSRNWQFYRGELTELSALKSQNMETVHLPHDFQISQPWVAPGKDETANKQDAANNTQSRLSARGFKAMGTGWYRRMITPEASWQGRRIILDIQGIMLVGDVFLNGVRIGGTDYGYLGFDIDLTKLLRYDKPNELIIRASTQEANNSRWFTGGGLFRDVNLIVTPQQGYFPRHPLFVRTIDNKKVCIQAEIYCHSKAKALHVGIDILDDKGVCVVQTNDTLHYNARWRQREYALKEIDLPEPHLWSCETPYLYTAVVKLLDEQGNVVDKVTQPFGMRTITFSPSRGLLVNGEKVLLKGFANHHTLGALGAAAFPRAIEKRLLLMKSFGYNHVRTAHNPYSEDFLSLCDKYGILVVDELYDKWVKQFAGGRTSWQNLWQNDIAEWVKRDRNHPSVIMWSLGNELQQRADLPFNDWGVTAYQLMCQLLHRYDTTRPTTVAIHPRYRSLETDSLPAPLAQATEVASYNYRYQYFPGDRLRFPHHLFYQSEASTAMMGPNYFGMDHNWVLGLAYWGSIDYLGESMGWPAKGWSQGVFDLSLQPKPNAYLVKSMFCDEPVVHIGIIEQTKDREEWNGINVATQGLSENWNRQPGDTVSLFTYTNADEVELWLNGKRIGTQQNATDAEHRNQIVWRHVAYQPGTLLAIAKNKGRIVARHQIETTGEVASLRIEADNTQWWADGKDLQHLRITAVDRKGRRVYHANMPLTFTLKGNATIAAVDNGDICSDELHTGNSRRLYHGTALVILRSDTAPSDITLNVSTPNMTTKSWKGKTTSIATIRTRKYGSQDNGLKEIRTIKNH